MSIRYHLKTYRLAKNYTQQYMAGVLHLSRQQYCNIENGKTLDIPADKRKKLCEVLDIPDTLLTAELAATPCNRDEEILALLQEQNQKLNLLLKRSGLG